MKKKGYSEYTMLAVGRRLRHIAKYVNLDNPGDVEELIAKKNCKNVFKEGLADAYALYVKLNGLEWKKPVYRREETAINLPTEERLDRIITEASPKYAVIFSLSKYGLRPVEISKLTLKKIDLENGVIAVDTAKYGAPRNIKIDERTLGMLKAFVIRNRFGLTDRMFPTSDKIRHRFLIVRKRIALKFQDSECLKIRLYDFRHWFATITYLKTRDILYVKYLLGHKTLQQTLKYIHMAQSLESKSDEYLCKVAKSLDEAVLLIKEGFEYVTEMDGIKIFRKRK